MRISDWSSDVCSSDLLPLAGRLVRVFARRIADMRPQIVVARAGDRIVEQRFAGHRVDSAHRDESGRQGDFVALTAVGVGFLLDHILYGKVHPGIRSEEHTSELQSLMRISYAVFCLKKKNNKKTKPI